MSAEYRELAETNLEVIVIPNLQKAKGFLESMQQSGDLVTGKLSDLIGKLYDIEKQLEEALAEVKALGVKDEPHEAMHRYLDDAETMLDLSAPADADRGLTGLINDDTKFARTGNDR